MTLVSQVNDLATRVGTEFKTVYSRQGSLASLATSNKTTLVAAINEIFAGGGTGGGPVINDTTPSTTTVYSATKTQAIVDAKPSINDAAASGTATYSSTKINSAISTAVAAKPSINDTTPSASTVYSSNKTDTQINAAVSALVNGSQATLDTLAEIASALGNDANFATTMTTALGNRLRFDAAQVLTGPQKTQGLTNLGAQAATDIGDTSTSFVTTFEAALI